MVLLKDPWIVPDHSIQTNQNRCSSRAGDRRCPKYGLRPLAITKTKQFVTGGRLMESLLETHAPIAKSRAGRVHDPHGSRASTGTTGSERDFGGQRHDTSAAC